MDCEADAAFTRTPAAVCLIMTADCLPVLFCDRAGTVVAAAHAGWRGLAAGVLEATLHSMAVAPGDVLAWLGPAIGPAAFEVGDEVYVIAVGVLMLGYVLFGGRVAEALIYGKNKVTTGASNDIMRATQLARNMVTKWGLSDKLGPMDYGDSEGGYMGPQAKPMSEKMAQTIDDEIRHVIDANYQRAETILKDHLEILHNMAHALLDWETIDKYQIDALMAGELLPPPEPEVEAVLEAASADLADHSEPEWQAGGQPQPLLS